MRAHEEELPCSRIVQVRAGHMIRVLVTEDAAAIGLWLEDVLADAGYVVMGPFAYGRRAEACLQTSTPDLAVLDVVLGDGSCVALAQTLQARGVPVLLFSGRAERMGLPEELRELPWLAKPARAEGVVEALRNLARANLRQVHPSSA